MSEVNSFMQIAGGSAPSPPSTAAAPATSPAEVDMFSAIASGQSQIPAGTPTMGPGPKQGLGAKIAGAQVPGTGVTVGEAGKRAGDFAKMAGEEALTLGGGPEGGTASILAEGRKAAEGISQSAKFGHIFDEGGEGAGILSKVKDALPSAATAEQAMKVARIVYHLGLGTGGAAFLWHELFGAK